MIKRHLGGWRPQRIDRRDLAFRPSFGRHPLAPSSDLRGSLDLRVEDQSSIGCCTAEGVTSAIEAATRLNALAMNQHPHILQLSPLWLYAQSRLFEGTALDDDSGCEIRDVIKVASEWGCALEASWPFDPARFADEPPTFLDEEAKQHRALFYYACDSDWATQAALLQGFPVVCGFDVPNHMMERQCALDGFVHHMVDDEGYAGGHCVLIVGHDDHKQIGPDVGGWLCLNSWGTNWALGGYFWLSYACHPRDRWTIRRVML